MSSDNNAPLRQFNETTSNKTMRKIKENPMVPIGMAGFFAAVVYGARNFKNRPKGMTPSMYVMRFRVFAQSIAVGAMGIGIGYTVIKTKFLKPEDKEVKAAKSS